MELLKYLKKHFPADGSYPTWTDEELQAHFLEQFGVHAKCQKTEPGTLWIFKYGQIEAKWKPVTRECRGAILWRTASWTIMSWPFNKFFNQHEGKSDVMGAKSFERRMHKFSFVEKLDGSCIQLWWDNYEWRVSTLGMITTTKISDFTEDTFASLFWDTLDCDLDDLPDGYTYIFELCSAQNRIITQYDGDVIYYLGRRDLRTGEIDQELPEILRGSVRLPKKHKFTDLGLTTLQECKDWVEAQSSSTEYGKYPEGFVIYDDKGPVCKMKNSAYLALYHASGAGNLAHSQNCAIDAFWKGTIDDVWEVLPDEIKKRINVLKNWYSKKIVEIVHIIGELRQKVFKPGKDGQKDYALAVQEKVDRRLQAFFFQNREQIEDRTVPAAELFSEWMRLNAGKWPDHWKEIMQDGVGDLR